jgi:hypothetical protein
MSIYETPSLKYSSDHAKIGNNRKLSVREQQQQLESGSMAAVLLLKYLSSSGQLSLPMAPETFISRASSSAESSDEEL